MMLCGVCRFSFTQQSKALSTQAHVIDAVNSLELGLCSDHASCRPGLQLVGCAYMGFAIAPAMRPVMSLSHRPFSSLIY